MTVTYTSEVATQRVGGFFRFLFRWRGSIYSVIYGEISIFMVLYAILSITYRHLLNDNQKLVFERLCIYFNQFSDYVPVTFVVGFYVARIIARRWTQWENIPWPDKLAFDVSVYVKGSDQRSRILRRTLIRYINLGTVLCFRDICIPVKKRFPTLKHLVNAGLMTESEVEAYESEASSKNSNWWIPFHWAYTLLSRAQCEGKIPDGYTKLQDGIMDLRNKCWILFGYDWVPIPMVYTQVATLSVYMFMLGSLFGRQYVENHSTSTTVKNKIDLYIPLFTILQLIFYLGWLKVGEVLISPMGMDADDFEMNYIVDRNLNLSYSVVDTNCNKLPPLEKDLHYDNAGEAEIPHTVQSQGLKDQPFKGSAAEQPANNTSKQTSAMDGDLHGMSPKMSAYPSQATVFSTRPPSGLWRAVTTLISRAPSIVERAHSREDEKDLGFTKVVGKIIDMEDSLTPLITFQPMTPIDKEGTSTPALHPPILTSINEEPSIESPENPTAENQPLITVADEDQGLSMKPIPRPSDEKAKEL